jgi:fibronectin type 3 domain-containing protein
MRRRHHSRRTCVIGVLLLPLLAGSWLGVPTDAHAEETLSALLSDVTTATAYRYTTRDDAGRSLDCLKIEQVGPGQYVGVSHTLEAGIFNVYLSTSTDLMHWTSVRRLDSNASQPTLAPDGNGGWLFADEVTKSIGGNYLRFRHYPTTEALMNGTYDRQFEPPNTLSAPGGAQGTPDFSAVSLAPDIDHSVIHVGFHYFDGRDLQATATLTNFSEWSPRPRADLDAKFVGASGNVGDRDFFAFQGHAYAMHEAQLRADDWGAWRVWLRDRRDDSVSELAMRTHGGSTAFGNPTVTMLTLPDGQPGIVVTDFIFSHGAARNESGELVFYKPLPPSLQPADAPPTAALAVTPSTGMTPLEVSADASASTDETGIASYAFDFGDGSPVVGPQAAPTATHSYATAGSYTVTVRVADTASLSSEATASVLATQDAQPPSPPANVSATATNPSRVELRWSEGTDAVAVTEYAIYRAPSGSPMARIGSSAAGVTTFADTGVAPGVAYDYSVTAIDGAGQESAPSNTSTVSTPPLTVTFAAAADATIDKARPRTNFGQDARMLVDNSPVDDALIRFEVATDRCTRVTGARLRLTDADASAKGGDFYAATAGWGETSVTWSTAPPRGTLLGSLGRVSAGATYSINVTAGVTTPNGPVGFRIGTTSSDGARYYSRESSTAARRPQLSVTCVGGTTVDALAPSAPTNLGATPMSSIRVDLTWTASTDDLGVVSYGVYRAPTGSTSFVKVGAASWTPTFSDTTVVPGVGYDYRVTAIDAATNESGPSNTVTATTPLTGGAGQTLTFTPSADATIDQTNSTTSLGSDSRLVVDNSPVYDALIQFDVAAPGCAYVTAATLRLTASDGSDKGGDFYTSAGGWSESSVSWSSAPAREALLTSLGAVSTGITYEVDVTAGVTTLTGTVSFRVGSTSNDGVRYYSKEGRTAAQRPQLTVSCS